MEKIIDLIFVIDLVVISFIDCKIYRIPNILNLWILFLKIIKIVFFGYSFESSIIGMGVYPIILLIIYGYISDYYKKELIGFGDIKLVSSIGFYVGYISLGQVITYYNIISLVGITLYYIIFKISKIKKIREAKLPFAPIVSLSIITFKILEKIL
ncbi:prepilin peptidase [Fusobacterium sp. MFO224]|uniref:prepilin peptidase n=1 Tax=Fusobacterium sp. MFO224 TaxID=3378070 RepID=UPI0038549CF4